MNVVNVVKPLHVTEISEYIKENILERNLMNVTILVKPFHNTAVSRYIKENILERNPVNCKQYGKALTCHSHLQRHERNHTERKP